MTIDLDNFRQRVSSHSNSDYDYMDPFPGTYAKAVQMAYSEERGNVAFLSTYNRTRYILYGYTLPELSRFGRWDLGERPIDEMAPFDNVDVDQPRKYLLCFHDSIIRLFDLVEFQFNPQEYISPVGNRWIRIEDFDEDGNLEMIGYDGDYLTFVRMQPLSTPEYNNSALLPAFYNISSFPNPFNSSTTITYALPAQSPVTLQVYNIRGQLVDVLLDRVMPAGRHSLRWDASEFSTGVYLVRMKDEEGSIKDIQKVVLVK